ncbi:hypothetical protein BSL78_11446 [Apostichopus japonicus]|uniref:Reverse transcriptase domain-containing protein n=1 Tax=Stichopus japonicus TaxID=307972 RepID=A0A2G8KUK5_STIJA|nr:hypothetical protein BSL78_11446 [Apostichopus japonicus]
MDVQTDEMDETNELQPFLSWHQSSMGSSSNQSEDDSPSLTDILSGYKIKLAKELIWETPLDEIEQHNQLTGCRGSISCFDVTYTKRTEVEPLELNNELTKYYVCSECRKEWFKRKSGNQKPDRVTPLEEIEKHTKLTDCEGSTSCFDVTYTKRNGGDPLELKNEPTKYYVCSECTKEWFNCKWEDCETHLQTHNVCDEFQATLYRPHHSTETAILRVNNDILQQLDLGHHVVLIMLDLSAAFDTVDHVILVNRLQFRYGLNGKVLQ